MRVSRAMQGSPTEIAVIAVPVMAIIGVITTAPAVATQ